VYCLEYTLVYTRITHSRQCCNLYEYDDDDDDDDDDATTTG